jgi:hypothetical protein
MAWVKETKENDALKKLLDGNRTVEREVAVHNFTCAQNGCRLVHCDDISNFRNAVRGIEMLGKKSTPETAKELRRSVENLAFPAYHSVVLEFERESIGMLLQSLRSLICRAHKLVIQSALFQEDKDDNAGQHTRELSSCIAVLSDEEYRAYLTSMLQLLSLLDGESKGLQSLDDEKRAASIVIHDDVRSILDSFHPAIRMKTRNEKSCSEEVLLFSLDGSQKQFSLFPAGICNCDTCMNEFAPLLQMHKPDQDDSIENISIDSTSGITDVASNSKDCSEIGTTTNPIVVGFDSDVEEVRARKVRVFECKSGSKLDEALSSLRTAAGKTPASDTEPSMLQYLRRSSRKRKTRYPVGCIIGEKTVDIEIFHNIAALRLLLYQNFEVPISSPISIAVDSETSSLPVGREVNFACNEISLEEIVKDLLGKPNIDQSDDYFVLYQKESEDSKETEASVMDSLIEASNLGSADKKSTNGKGKRKRVSERGFRGTLLQSSSSVGGVSNQSDSPATAEKEASAENLDQKSREPPSMVALSDEEKQVDDYSPESAQKEVSSDSSPGGSMCEKKDENEKGNISSPPASKRPKKSNVKPTVVLIRDEDDDDDNDGDGNDIFNICGTSKFKDVFSRIKNNGFVGDDIDSVALSDAICWAIRKLGVSQSVDDISAVALEKFYDGPQTDGENQSAGDVDHLSKRLSSRLKESDHSRNEKDCLNAVMWAIKENKGKEEDEIYNAAVAKYIQDSSD